MSSTMRLHSRPTTRLWLFMGPLLALCLILTLKSSAPPRRLAAHTAVHLASSDQGKLDAWKSTLFTRAMALYRGVEHAAGAVVEPMGARRFDLFTPFLKCPNGRSPVRFGDDADGGKLLCADMLASSDCVVFSLGSNDDFTFEEDILARTPCTVVTFDCTVDGRTVHARHKFVKKCLGGQDRQDADPALWTTLESAMADLNIRRLDLLKIDIEGAEYDVLGSWSQSSASLPLQIAMEVHYDDIYYGTPAFKNGNDVSNLVWPLHVMRLSDLALFMSHLAGAGYGIVSREDNERSPHCSELTLVRV